MMKLMPLKYSPLILLDNPNSKTTIHERLMSKVKYVEGCWEFRSGWRPVGGGGALGIWQSDTGKTISKTAYRISYKLFKGDIPEGKVIDHLCRNRACINPDHLEVVTQAENVSRSSIQISSINKGKTECLNGHPFNIDNTYIYKTRRVCKKCACERTNRYKQRMQNRGNL